MLRNLMTGRAAPDSRHFGPEHHAPVALPSYRTSFRTLVWRQGFFYDEQNNRTMFLREGAVLAVIAPVTDERRIDGALRSRVESA